MILNVLKLVFLKIVILTYVFIEMDFTNFPAFTILTILPVQNRLYKFHWIICTLYSSDMHL